MRQILRLSTILPMFFAVVAGVLLFLISQGVQRAEGDVQRLQNVVSHEEKTIHVLRAEWDYLNSPMRLEKMASEYLGMTSPGIQNVIDNGRGLPDYIAPVIPVKKPNLLLRDAVFQIPSEEKNDVAAISAPHDVSGDTISVVPRPISPPPYLRRQSFDSLINDLSKRGGRQ